MQHDRSGSRRLSMAVLPGVVLVWASLTPAPAPGADRPSVDELLARLEARYQETEAISCEIEQTKRLQALTRPVALHGSILFMKPHYLRVELDGDESLAIYANGETIWFVDRDLDEVETLAFADGADLARMLPGFALGGVAALRRLADVSQEHTDQARHRLVFTLRADSGLPFSRITLDLDGMLRIQRSEVLYRNGDSVLSRFRKWQRLPRLSPHAFVYRE